MTKDQKPIRNAIVGFILLIMIISPMALVRRDRYRRPHVPLEIDGRTIRLPAVPVLLGDEAGGPRGPGPNNIPRAAEELREAAATANAARAGLEETKRDLERVKQEIEAKQREIEAAQKDFDGLRADADARQKAVQQELAAAQRELEAQRAEMEQGARQAEERVARARQELERLERARLAAAAQAGIARGLGAGPRLEMQVAADPRRVRNPALPPFVPNDAAVAAAATAGRRNAGGGEGGGGRGGPLFSTTVQGDILRGQAERIEAEGQYALDTSAAAINAQTAQAMSLDNRIRAVETFFESRRINRINRAYEAGPRVSFEKALKLSRMGLPPRPTSLQLDPQTGEVAWPKILTSPEYADLTSRIQRRFKDRAERNGIVDYAACQDCDAACGELKERLRQNLPRYSAGDYGAASNFVDGLQREFDLPFDD